MFATLKNGECPLGLRFLYDFDYSDGTYTYNFQTHMMTFNFNDFTYMSCHVFYIDAMYYAGELETTRSSSYQVNIEFSNPPT